MTKSYFIIIATLVFFASCSTSRYYSVMNTNNPYTEKTDKREFVIKGDSLDVFYRFSGENAPITIGIQNKMNHSVYVDLRKSGIYIGDKYTAFADPNLYTNPTGDTIYVDYNRMLSDRDGIFAVGAGKRMDKKVMELANFRFHRIPNESYKKQGSSLDEKGKKFRSINYVEENTPLLFNTILTIYPGAHELNSPVIIEDEFYMSELVRGGGNKPQNVEAIKSDYGDVFYVQHKNGKVFKQIGKTSLKALGVIGLVAASATAEIVIAKIFETEE